MTDREAIRRMAELLYDHFGGRLQDRVGALLCDLAEPAAPTVAREQAEWVVSSLEIMRVNTARAGLPAPLPAFLDPAFFRAVADALEGE